MNWSKTTLITLGVFCVLILPAFVFAQAPTVSTVGNNNALVTALYNFAVTFFGWLAGMTGGMFDYAVSEYIINFGGNFLGSSVGAVIDNLWSTVRDIFNLTFIFGLVYIGFQMILKNTTDAQKSLGYLIGAALLVNFSLFITKFIIDFSNMAADQIYQAFVTSSPSGGIALAYVQLIGLSGVFSSQAVTTSTESFGYIFGLILLLLISTFVFGAGAIMMMIRYISLNLYMVFSPLLFLGWVFPGMASFSRDHWRGFLGKAFFAPAFIFMLYLSYQVIATYDIARTNNIAASINGGSGAMTAAGNSDAVESFAFFILAMGFMIASLVVAQKMGAQGASTAISVGQNIRRRGQRIMTQPARWGARNASSLAGSGVRRGLNTIQTSQIKDGTTRRGKALAGVLRGAQALSRTTTVEQYVGGAATAMQAAKMGTGLTQAQKDAQTAATRTAVSNRVDIARGITARNSPEEQAYQARLKRQAEIDAEHKALSDNYAVLLAAYNADPTLVHPGPPPPPKMVVLADGVTEKDAGTLTADEQAAIDPNDETTARQAIIAKMEVAVADLGTKDLEAMSSQERESIAEFMSKSQEESLLKSDNLNDSDKAAMMAKRIAAIKKLVAQNSIVISEKLQKLSIAQLETMGAEWINQNAADLSDKQIEELAKSKKFTESQITSLKSKRETDIKARHKEAPVVMIGGKVANAAFLESTTVEAIPPPAGSAPGTLPTYKKKYGKQKKAAEIAKMPASVLTDRASAEYITADVLKEIVSAKVLSQLERQTIAENLIGPGSTIAIKNAGGVELNKQEKLIEKMLKTGSNQKMKDEFGQ